jgi:hypothetical protein
MGIVWSMAFHAVNITTPMVVPKKMLLSLISDSVAGSPWKSLGRKVTILILPFAEGSGPAKGQAADVIQKLENGALGPDSHMLWKVEITEFISERSSLPWLT